MTSWARNLLKNKRVGERSTLLKIMVISIERAEYKSEYCISFKFSDGTEKNIDFGNFLKNAKNPMTRKCLNEGLFQSFIIEYGDIVWNDYEMCFPIWNLHEGEI